VPRAGDPPPPPPPGGVGEGVAGGDGVAGGVGVAVGIGVGFGGTGAPPDGSVHPIVWSHCSTFVHQGVVPVHPGNPGRVAAPAAAGQTMTAAAITTHIILSRRVHARSALCRFMSRIGSPESRR
jgi:hypothetical protein